MKVCLIQSCFVLFSLLFAYNSSAQTLSSCPRDQSVALIQFSNSFSVQCSDASPCSILKAKTTSWKKVTDCCLWDGVKCDTETGNVVGLDLSCSCIIGPLPSNSTLFLLRHLHQLDLSNNDFRSSLVASQFGQFANLIHLNISGSGFTGTIPLTISHLSKLESLDLSHNGLFFEGHVFEKVVGNLTQLRHLLLTDVNMSAVEPTSFLNMSSYIKTLTLENSGLQGNFPENVFSFPYLEEFRFTTYLEGQVLEFKFPKTNWGSSLKSLQVSCSFLQELPDSIGNLRSLEILDLSYSNLSGPFPASLANLTRLVSLRLSNNNLSGVLPISIFNLTQVEFLDFSNNKLVGSLPSQVTGLSRLAELHLDHNFLSGRVPSWLFSLPSLVELGISNNRLTGPIGLFDKVAPLEAVDLSNNEIQGPIPDPISELVNLTDLDLSSNNLSGSFELDKLSKLSKLKQLSLSDNALLSLTSARPSIASYSLPNLWRLNLSSCNTSEFPNFVRNLPGLTEIDLSYNRIRVVEANMFVKLKSLQQLDLSHNRPLSFSNINNLTVVLPSLTTLYMSSCNITQLSNFLTTQESLTYLDLSNNSIRGRITEQENNWGSNLSVLDLSNNLLTAVEYYPWKNVETLNLGSNLLEGPLLVPPISTQRFLISKNRLIGEIPASICNIGFDSNILDLSHNNLSGELPKCLAYAKLYLLYLHMNHFHGNIPDFCVDDYSLSTLNLHNNDFEGPLPKSLVNCENLEVLNLGNNRINDTFPHWLGSLPQLQVLALRANYFHGQIIPSENGSHFSTLRILDISDNEFSGFLPTTYFKSFKSMINLSQVQMGYMSSYYQDSVVITMKGVDIELKRILTIFATIDMSSNRFEGTIPDTVGNLISLNVLNFSHNHLTGHIPSSLGNLATVESLDLSYNKLVGEIPSQLTGLNFLAVLNLSENQLVGPIPQGKQFNTFLNNSYIGNSGLCGFPVSKTCGHSEPPPATFDEQEADSEFRLDWKIVIIGYGCGVVFGFSAGYIMMATGKPKWLAGMIQRAGNKVLKTFKKKYH
ncbi:hypothetical protein V6N11_038476 [Hibiscus sabdariffa]|uniref:Leucine-rich repeat-containing N-terminal plant-type domain-containing protein n=1 Tax=Hibiscus sabdariffa TaxID=183260 RepID=A0ABR2SK61_9ROSI